MSAKITASRRAAFLRCLSESGNMTLSAERAKVSLTWVRMLRGSDAGFDAACVAALGQARDRLREHPYREPSRGWGFADGAELVVSGTNGRRTQVRRARHNQWTPRVERRFLEALAATCNVKAACREAGMSVGSAYVHRARWPQFERHWKDAIAVGYAGLEAGLIEGATAFLDGEELGELELGGAIRVASVGEAIQLLTMNRHAVTGFGKRRRG